MNYRKLMEQIFAELAEYKRSIDAWIVPQYLRECRTRDEEIQNMQGKYTNEYIQEYIQNWEPDTDYGELIRTAREQRYTAAKDCLDQIQQELDGYFSAPVTSDFAATLTSVKALGLNLTNLEFSLLENNAKSYLDRRLLNELAITRCAEVVKTKLNQDSEPEAVKANEPKPFNGIFVPDAEIVYNDFQGVKNAVDTAFTGYCGENYILKDIIFPLSEATEQTNAKLVEEYGIAPPKQIRSTIDIIKMSGAEKCFDRNYAPYVAFIETMDKLESAIPKPPKKTTLTSADVALINTLIDPTYPSLAQGKATEIAKADERLAELLLLDPRYNKAVAEALKGGSK